MEYGDFWLLEAAVEGSVPLDLLIGDEQFFRDQWNKHPHGLARHQLVNTLRRLLAAGDVECFSDLGSEVLPSHEELDGFLGEPEVACRIWYGLTAQGAARWEQAAKPDWSRYFWDRWDSEQQSVEFTAATSASLQRLLVHGPLEWWVAWVPRTEERSIVMPWHATYWKTLPEGHHIQLRYSDDPAACPPRTVENEAKARQAHRALRGWYTPWAKPT
jgi:hypothetical protein